jgi:hypothetical protein
MPRALRSRLLWAVAFLGAAAGGVALGAVRSKPAEIAEPVAISGTLTYVWHGDPGRGCAAEGLCGSHGSVVVHFDGYGDLSARGPSGSVAVDGASATARVRRDDPGAQPADCVDAISVVDFGISLHRAAGRQWVATLDGSPVSGGRCAGPLARDLARLRLPAVRLRSRGLGFDVHGRAAFGAGPFSGELISTLVLRRDTSEESSSGGGESTVFSGPPPSRPRHVPFEYARLRYRITGAAGALGVSFAGEPSPACIPLDACATTGTLQLTIDGFRGEIQVSGSREVNRRIGRDGALADVRAGRLGVVTDTPSLLIRTEKTAESLGRSAGQRCSDASYSALIMLPGSLGRPAPGIQLTLENRDDAVDPWRTHCPGPSINDVSGGSPPFGPFGPSPLATGSLALSSLGSARAEVPLGIHGAFRGNGYSGTRGGALRFSLVLLSVQAGTREELIR